MNSNRIPHLQLRPVWSRQFFYWLVFTHGCGVIAIWQLESTLVLKITLLIILTLFFGWAVRRHLLGHGRYAVKEAWAMHDGGWRLLSGNGELLQARLLSDSFVQPWLIVLRFNTGRFRYAKAMVLFPDSLDKSVYRNLRIYLRRSANERKRSF